MYIYFIYIYIFQNMEYWGCVCMTFSFHKQYSIMYLILSYPFQSTLSVCLFFF